MLDLINLDFLARPRSVSAKAQIDTSNVGTRLGEFKQEELEAAAMHPEAVQAIADEIVTNSEGRRGILIFGCGVKHARLLQEAVIARGISCESIFDDTPMRERDRCVELFKKQEIRALAGMDVLTTGFNAPHVDMIALARATKSTGLYIQIVGRGTRKFPGKDDCLVLDFGGNIKRHGALDKPKIQVEKKDENKEKEKAPTKTCNLCGTENSLGITYCIECGFKFPEIIKTVRLAPSAAPMLSSDMRFKVEWLKVNAGVSYSYHQPRDLKKPPSLKVTYRCGARGTALYHEYVCFQHTGFPREKAGKWWISRVGYGKPVPRTVREALENSHLFRQPSEIKVEIPLDNGFPSVKDVKF